MSSLVLLMLSKRLLLQHHSTRCSLSCTLYSFATKCMSSIPVFHFPNVEEMTTVIISGTIRFQFAQKYSLQPVKSTATVKHPFILIPNHFILLTRQCSYSITNLCIWGNIYIPFLRCGRQLEHQ